MRVYPREANWATLGATIRVDANFAEDKFLVL
jgi:hypothetical protein